MVCRTTRIGSAIISTTQQTTGLTERQCIHLFHTKIQEGSNARTPSERYKNAEIDKLIAYVKNNPQKIDPRRAQSIINRLEMARREPMDGRTYYAVKKILPAARKAYKQLEQYLQKNINPETKNLYESYSHEAYNNRKLRAPKEWKQAIVKKYPNLPLDRITSYALHQLEQRTPTTPQHVNVEDETIQKIGYNPQHEHLQIVTRPGQRYNYRNITEQQYHDLIDPENNITKYYENNIAGNINHQYYNQNKAANASQLTRCETCGQYTHPNTSHQCLTNHETLQPTLINTHAGKPPRLHKHSPTLKLYPTKNLTPSPLDRSINLNENPQQYYQQYREAEQIVENNGNPINYETENVLPEHMQHYTFGIELEFDFPSTMTKYQKKQALQNIGQQLYEEGYTNKKDQQDYHISAEKGYSTKHERGWRFEKDNTVDGEIISPIMTDTPQTWQTIPRICQIIEQNGGRTSQYTGTHVHVGTQHYGEASQEKHYTRERYAKANEKVPTPPPAQDQSTINNYRNLITTIKENEELLYHLSTNPKTGEHRGKYFCQPNMNNTEGYNAEHPDQNLHSYTGIHADHNIALNLQSVKGKTSDNVEYRTFDGSHSPEIIQAYIKLAANITDYNHRRDTDTTPQLVAPTTANTEQHHQTYMTLADQIFTRDNDKKQMIQLLAWIDTTQKMNKNKNIA